MEPYNPYSPPESRESAPRPRFASSRARGTWIKWAFLLDAAGLFIVGVGAGEMAAWVDPGAVQSIYWFFLLGWVALTTRWIYTAWSEIPRPMPGAIDPGDAVWKLFIPLFNLYWGFFVSGALCDVLNRRLARLRLEPMAPKGLSVLGCSLQIAGNLGRMPGFVGIAPFIAVIGHGVWFNYMLECDRARVILAEHVVED